MKEVHILIKGREYIGELGPSKDGGFRVRYDDVISEGMDLEQTVRKAMEIKNEKM